MARPGPGHPALCGRVACDLAHGHDFFPIGPVPILDHHGDGTTEGLPLTYTGEESNLVALDLHPAAAAVALLPASQFVVDEFEIDSQVGRNALHQCYQGLPVRLSGRVKAQHASSIAGGK